jgi:predicted phosphodiesterase
LFFEISEPSQGLLIFGSASAGGNMQDQVPLDSTQTRHMIDLEGLAPGVEYKAVLLLGEEPDDLRQPLFDGEIWGAVNFRTPGGVPLRVGALGDASFGDEATTQLVQLISSMDLDFVVVTGDVVYETESSDLFSSYLGKFFKPFAPLLRQGPVYTVMGNHDYDASMLYEGAPFYDYAFPPFEDPTFEYPPERRGNQFYAHAVGDIQFLMLDSQAIFGAGGRTEQDAWMKERLADPRFSVTIPVFHVSPYSSSIVHPDDGTPVRQSWNYLFEQANVPLVLSGHFHHYERLSANDITYIVTGGGSSILYAQGTRLPESFMYVPRTHFVLLEFYPDRIELQAISKEGDIFDRVTIPLN